MNKGKTNMSKKIILIVGFVITIGLLMTNACWTETVKEENGDTVNKPELAVNENNSPFEKVDFKNFSYPLKIDAKDEKEKSLTLKDGKLEKSKESNGAELGKIQYADLTGDGVDEAIIDLGITEDKNTKSNVVYVYTLEDEKPKLLWSFETKGGEESGLKAITADNGKLLVEMFGDVQFVEGNWKMADTKQEVKGKYTKTELKWNGKKFVVEGKPEIVEVASKT
jgi:hypothetical protein